MSQKFQRKIEDFVCENCGFFVQGNGYTNHCPECLFSKHVDNFPGDRKNECGGLLEPVGIKLEKGEKIIIFRCQKCGEEKRNRVSEKDNQEKILSVLKANADSFWKD